MSQSRSQKPLPILIADDSPDDLLLITRQLKAARIVNPVHMVEDGEKVICYLKGEGTFANREKYPYPGILFLDLKLPGMSGYEILTFLKASVEHRGLPVIILSGMNDLKNITQAYQKGANSFLVKPVETSELMNTLRSLRQLTLLESAEGFCIEANK